jgi:murein DD-endopeptidase MepM/ murein hydrolase activator NlpD
MILKRGIFSAAVVLIAGCAPIKRPLPPEAEARPSAVFAEPLKGAHLLSPFGPRGSRYHTGLDLQVSRKGGEPVRASRAGVVTRATVMSGYGRVVEVRHEDGFTTRYAHLKSMNVTVKQRVEQGETLGLVGQTGRATTPHLHFEILTPKFRFANPADYL